MVLAAVLAGCAVPPKPELPPLRGSAPLAGIPTAADAAWPAADWWSHYGDAGLDALEQKALSNSPNLAEARARLETALRAVDAARAAAGATLDGNIQYQRQRLSENGLIPSEFLGFNWYSQGDIGLSFKYDFDFWGKQRATIEAALDSARAAIAERNAAMLMLSSAIADTWFAWQADHARLALARKLVDARIRFRQIVDARVRAGIEPPDSLREADANLADAREQQAALKGSARIRRAALAALLGVAPADLPPLVAKPLPSVSAGLPQKARLDLIARRPDIVASRWRVEAALQKATAARAAFYPDLSLSAMIGLSSIDLGKLLTAGSRVADISPALHLPIFEGGRLRARYGQTQAGLAAAAAAYDSAVVNAARDVATQALKLEQIDARRRQSEARLDATQAMQDAIKARVDRGLVDDRELLAAGAKVIAARDAELVLDGAAIDADIALIKALGGGYREPSSSKASLPGIPEVPTGKSR